MVFFDELPWLAGVRANHLKTDLVQNEVTAEAFLFDA
jgi:hypothetical protein